MGKLLNNVHLLAHVWLQDLTPTSVVTLQDIWPDHPEKVLGATAEFVEQNPNTARALVMAMLDAANYAVRPEVSKGLGR